MYKIPEGLGLGRRYSPDARDQGFLMSDVPRRKPERKFRYWWTGGNWGDQGSTPQCVGYSWAHWVEDGPITHAPKRPGSGFIVSPANIYNEAQLIDAWPGEDYDGTSVRAGAKVLQSKGLIESYHWAWDVETVVDAILTKGPVVVGTWWYSRMFYPDERGLIKVEGQKSGGHAYVLNGVNVETGIIRIKNSWGRNWGKRGFGYISISDMGRLISEQGEACLAIENPTD